MGTESFRTLISLMGKFYSITVKFPNGNTVEFRDSYKKLPLSVKAIAKAYGFEEGKGEIDYHAPRPVGHRITEEEADYIRRDVSIVAKALAITISEGAKKLTIGSDAMTEFKTIIGSKLFSRLFPVFPDELDREIRRAYRGGFTYADPRFKSRILGCGLVLDVNSLYPFIMYSKLIPYGEPEFVEGYVEPTDDRPLTIFSVTFTAKIKPNHIPCIQIKGTPMFVATEYLTEINDPTTLMVTNVDWELYLEHYDIEVQSYGGGWRFKAMVGMFNTFIEKWSKIKENSEGGLRVLAKLILNNLYGKFASNPNVTGKIPVLVDGVVKLVRGEDETRAPVYTPAGVFITSHARDLTIRAAQDNYDVFAYADTDSLHLLTDTVPDTLDVHPTRLGAWKLEYHFDAAFYVRPKAYLERHPECICKPGERAHAENARCYTNRMAGVHESVSELLTFDDLEDGKTLQGGLKQKAVPGGVILKNVPYELKL